MKALPLTLVTATGLALSQAAQADLLISEYVEGSGFNKAIELYNSGTQDIVLSDYALIRYTNGDAAKANTISLDPVTLAAGETYVIVENNSQTDALLVEKADQTSPLSFNGDDPIALIKTSDNSVADFFGTYGDINFAKDKTYARITTQAYTDGEWDSSAWSVLPKNDFSGLGIAPDGSVTEPPTFSCSGAPLTPIYDIQGDGSASPFEGNEVYTSGVVTLVASSLYNGLFIQDTMGDGDSQTSDGLFVYSTNLPNNVAVGDEVCVKGKVTEYYGLTELALSDSQLEVLSQNNTVPATPLELSNDSLLHEQMEAYEGMLVTTTNSDLVVTRPFSFDYDSYRNNMVLSYAEPLFKSTHLFAAGTEAEQTLAANNTQQTLFVDTDTKAPDGVIPYFSGFNAEDGYIRIGDKVENLEGVIGYSYAQYRLLPVANENLAKSDFVHAYTDRTAYGPELDKTGDLRVASFNVLNLFNSPFGGTENPFGDNRGAESPEEFNKQLTKIANAVTLMDADIIGLMELENNGFSEDSAIAALVNAINSSQPANAEPYRYIAPKTATHIGSDAITVGMLYRPDIVRPIRKAKLIDMPEQHGTDSQGNQFDKYQRTALLQTFVHKRSGQRLSVVVNHFKSKGSGCIEDANTDTAGPQSNCNAFRVSAAVRLGDYLERYVHGNVLILGDLNSYGKEDPIRVLTDYNAFTTETPIMTAEQTTVDGMSVNNGKAQEVLRNYGFINLVPHFQGDKSFSYSYNSEVGSLDHALASWQLLQHVVDADDWHINAAESNIFEYSTEHTGNLVKSDNAYSSSDHDPVVIELQMGHNYSNWWWPYNGGFNGHHHWGWWR